MNNNTDIRIVNDKGTYKLYHVVVDIEGNVESLCDEVCFTARNKDDIAMLVSNASKALLHSYLVLNSANRHLYFREMED